MQKQGLAMQTVAEIADQIVAREGGFVDDPDDPGGATNFGVTMGTMRRLGLDLTGDGGVDVADVRALSRAQAVEILVEEYFRRPGLGALPEVLQPPVFDMYVNSGSQAVRVLQRLLGQMGQDLAEDGVIGPVTIRAAHAADAAAPGLLADAYGVARRNYYYALADRRPQSRKFARRRDGGKGGWIVRAEAFISPKYQLSAAAHRERTRAWG